MQQVEGGRISQEDLSHPLQHHRTETRAKYMPKNKEKNTNAGCLQDYPLQKSNKTVPCLANWPRKHSHTSWRREKTNEKWTPT